MKIYLIWFAVVFIIVAYKKFVPSGAILGGIPPIKPPTGNSPYGGAVPLSPNYNYTLSGI